MHHEAQKFTMTGWPRSATSCTRPGPRRRGRSKSGAGEPAGATPAADVLTGAGSAPFEPSLLPACTVAKTAIAAKTSTPTSTKVPTLERDRRPGSGEVD